MLKRLIKKPVLATVISIILVILGSLAIFKLPLQKFPDIAPPCVVVNAIYPGANAEIILRSVAPSLEEAINGVGNMAYMTSTASNDGTLVISVFFNWVPIPIRLPSTCKTVSLRRPPSCRRKWSGKGLSTLSK